MPQTCLGTPAYECSRLGKHILAAPSKQFVIHVLTSSKVRTTVEHLKLQDEL
jgi:hypothetical protein